MRDSITLLHLSDPQFGAHHRFGNPSTLFTHLSDSLNDLRDKEKVRPDVIAVSGDLAEWGMKNEFDDALRFLTDLCDLLKVPRKHVVIVPGNHDINRKQCASYFLQCDADGEKPVEPYYAKWKQFEQFFQQFYAGEKGISFTPAEPWTFWEMDNLNLVVAGLNSTMVESHLDSTHYGWIGEQQLRWFRDRLVPYRDRGFFRLGVVHHNVMRGAQDDDENLRDADELTNTLGPSLDLILHGHTHNARLAWLSPSLPVLSTGSTALKTEQRPAEIPNQYQLIRLWPDRLERRALRYEWDQKRWAGDTRCSDDGKHWHTTHNRGAELFNELLTQDAS